MIIATIALHACSEMNHGERYFLVTIRTGYRANVSRTAGRGRSFKRTACTLTSINVLPPASQAATQITWWPLGITRKVTLTDPQGVYIWASRGRAAAALNRGILLWRISADNVIKPIASGAWHWSSAPPCACALGLLYSCAPGSPCSCTHAPGPPSSWGLASCALGSRVPLGSHPHMVSLPFAPGFPSSCGLASMCSWTPMLMWSRFICPWAPMLMWSRFICPWTPMLMWSRFVCPRALHPAADKSHVLLQGPEDNGTAEDDGMALQRTMAWHRSALRTMALRWSALAVLCSDRCSASEWNLSIRVRAVQAASARVRLRWAAAHEDSKSTITLAHGRC